MTTDTTATGETTQVADTGAKAAEATTTTGTTVLTGDEASKTAEGAEAGAKGAETGADGEKPKEGETEGDKSKEKPDDGSKPEGPPEKYEFTMPEGVELDAGLAEKVDPILRELNLTNDQANKLANAFAEHRVSEAQRQSDAYAQQVEDWGKQAREDKEFGGAAFEQNVPLAQKAIAQFGTPELKTLLADGLGNHPELIRFCVKVGKAIGEDGGVDGGSAATPKSPADVLFDHPSSKPKR
ncbi:hypothetical protein [Luteibacter sp.]|uniref:hypothetical protein n=1 Tax=Luteibacter sp. TaxID=1886636 RepID=UPI002809AB41|nr:hypothetical protein [Luteibacter sp.]MDQ8050730.1 hypothetical protein [Luteibacter sp.]